MTADLVARLEEYAPVVAKYGLVQPHSRASLAALLREAASALRSSGEAVEPHCSGHERFDYDCIDCSDALERKRKGNTPGDGTYPMKVSGEAVACAGTRIHEVAGKMVQDHYDNSGALLSRIPVLHGLDGMDDALAFPATPATVTDEDVERAFASFFHHAHGSGIACMRAALESFVRKQPAASAALER